MSRRIVSLAGPTAQFAVADDGTCWYWNGAAWVPWDRPGLPEAVPKHHPLSAQTMEEAFAQDLREAERLPSPPADLEPEYTARASLHVANHPPFVAQAPPAETPAPEPQKPAGAPKIQRFGGRK